MAQLLTVGVPWDSYAREAAVADASLELRKRGLVDRLALRHHLKDWGELVVPAPEATRAEGSGLFNQGPLIVMCARVRDAVAYGCDEGYTPLVYGGDCAVLLGCLAGARDVHDEVGLVFVDSHEDAFPLEASPDGQAADSELALVLGLTGETAPLELRRWLPVLRAEHLAMLGPRNREELANHGVVSLRETLGGEAFFLSDEELRARGVKEAAGEAARVAARAGRWWLHIDLDVLDYGSFPAQDFRVPGGLSWQELLELSGAALEVGGDCGVSVVSYNPELDPERIVAELIVEYVEWLALQLR